MEESRLIVDAATDPGTVRERNEDLVYHARLPSDSPDGAFVLAVADGMGGYDRGEVASRIAIDALVDRFEKADTDDTVLMIRQAYRSANESIYDDGLAKGDHNMMGTTLVTAIINDNELTIANVGDSRAYLLRAGVLNQITEDHSLIAEQVKVGVLTEEEARESQHKNIITRAVGYKPRIDVDIFELTLLPDDRLLLTTDGVHDYIDEDDLHQIVAETTPDQAPGILVQHALAAGSTDNLTALVAWYAPISSLEAPTLVEQPAGSSFDYAWIAIPALVLVAIAIVAVIIALLVLFA